jgi:RecA-family ATPase
MIAGPSGAGKSHLIGTYPGKVLYLTAGAEVHGVDAARKTGKNVTAITLDRDASGPLSADATLARFDAATDAAAVKAAGFRLIALDGLTELEKIVRATGKWKAICTTKGGGHDSFKEGPATIAMMDHCLSRLRNLQFELGLDIAVTCILDVTEVNKATGEIEAAKPRLQSYQVAESMIQQFGDIVIIGSMTNAEGKSGRVIQMQTDLVRKSVDLETKEVKKIFGITPRLQGVDTVPPYVKADLGSILNLKGR